MLVRLFDKIPGVPEGTVKNLPTAVAQRIIEKGLGELADSKDLPASPKPKQTKKTTAKTKKK